MRVFSTFSGISAATAAWKHSPWRPLNWEFVGYCEIEPFPCHVLADRCGASAPRYLPEGFEHGRAAYSELPEAGIPNFGDVSQVTDDDLRALGPVDLLEGGPPCQAFSLSGKRGGTDDSRGQLTLEFVLLAERMRRINGLKWVLFENVTGILSDKNNAFGHMLAYLAGERRDPVVAPGGKWKGAGRVDGPDASIAWRTLDSQFFDCSQSRRRVWVLAGVGATGQRGDPAEVLFEPEIDPGSTAASRAEVVRLRGSAEASAPFKLLTDVHVLSMDSRASHRKNIVYALKAANAHNPPAVIHKREVPRSEAEPFGWRWVVRSITPLEAERLQRFPDGWTAVSFDGQELAADKHRYKACGNSMPVTVLTWIGERLAGRGLTFNEMMYLAVNERGYVIPA